VEIRRLLLMRPDEGVATARCGCVVFGGSVGRCGCIVLCWSVGLDRRVVLSRCVSFGGCLARVGVGVVTAASGEDESRSCCQGEELVLRRVVFTYLSSWIWNTEGEVVGLFSLKWGVGLG